MNLDTMYTKCVSLLRQLHQWRRRWYNLHCEDFFETPPLYYPSTFNEDIQDLPWKTVWHFSSLYTAQPYANYHSILILVLRTMWNLEMSGILSVEHPVIDRSRQIYDAGIEICRSVDYHLIESQKGAGSIFLLVSVRYAWKAFELHSLEARWLEATMTDISTGKTGRWGAAEKTLSKFEHVVPSPIMIEVVHGKATVSPDPETSSSPEIST